MLKDEPGNYTAYHAGQEDYLKGLLPSPKRRGIEDSHRRMRYHAGYDAEAADAAQMLVALRG